MSILPGCWGNDNCMEWAIAGLLEEVLADGVADVVPVGLGHGGGGGFEGFEEMGF
jgi:hypothetical protein